MTKQDKQMTTATEVMIMREMKRTVKLNYLMAKALVKGRVDSHVLRYAEEVYRSQKAIFEAKESTNE